MCPPDLFCAAGLGPRGAEDTALSRRSRPRPAARGWEILPILLSGFTVILTLSASEAEESTQ
jgi:hypothetical protein